MTSLLLSMHSFSAVSHMLSTSDISICLSDSTLLHILKLFLTSFIFLYSNRFLSFYVGHLLQHHRTNIMSQSNHFYRARIDGRLRTVGDTAHVPSLGYNGTITEICMSRISDLRYAVIQPHDCGRRSYLYFHAILAGGWI